MPSQAALLIGEITHARPEWEQLSFTLTLKVFPPPFSKRFTNRLFIEQEFPSGTREQFLANCKNGEYDDVVVIYRSNVSTKHTGRFDKELVSALPKSVKYIVHNGAGYDNIDVPVVTEAGTFPATRLCEYAYD